VRRVLFVAGLFALASTAPRPQAASASAVLVELFTSEGCSDCPPADALLQKLVLAPPAGAQVIALGQHVDYWDRLGWKDRFSSAELTQRQQLYASRFNNESIYTPQMVVDGRAEFVGSDAAAAKKAIERAAAASHPQLLLAADVREPSRVGVHVSGHDFPKDADIIVAVTEDGLQSAVRSGENRGRTLYHAAVVRQMKTIGEVKDGSAAAQADVALAPEWKRDQIRIVAFVQERRSRAIVSSAEFPLKIAR
jgi:hypothetical protein